MVADSTDFTQSSALDVLTQTVTRSVLEKVNKVLESPSVAAVEPTSNGGCRYSCQEQEKIEKLAASILQNDGEGNISIELDGCRNLQYLYSRIHLFLLGINLYLHVGDNLHLHRIADVEKLAGI